MIELPPFDRSEDNEDSSSEYDIELEDTTYIIGLYYLERTDSWYFNIFDSARSALLTGVRLSIDYPIFKHKVREGLPPGQIMLLDTSGNGQECSFEDLGNRCILVYFLESEIPTSSGYAVTIDT